MIHNLIFCFRAAEPVSKSQVLPFGLISDDYPSTGDPVIGVPAVVAGAAVSVAGAAVSMGGTAIAAIAADNFGNDASGYHDSFGCGNSSNLP